MKSNGEVHGVTALLIDGEALLVMCWAGFKLSPRATAYGPVMASLVDCEHPQQCCPAKQCLPEACRRAELTARVMSLRSVRLDE